MAEGTTVSRGTICPFFLYSSCQEGSRCQYTHDANSPRRNVESVMCRFFLKGMCKYGDSCWFSHTSAKNDVNTKSKNDKQSAGPSRQRTENQSAPSTPKRDVNKSDTYQPKYSFLHRNGLKKDKVSVCGPDSPNWVNAPEFVPKTIRSYADTLKTNAYIMKSEAEKLASMEMCSYFYDGECPYSVECPFIHGDLCELCGKYCLNPLDEIQRKQHTEYCEKELEQDMELSFAIQRSLDKSCGICMDVIMEKDPASERRFGILEKCNHVFCLACIRKWRRVKTFESTQPTEHLVDPVVTRACPECRVASDFITPSQYWVDTEEEKTKLISDYKVALSKKPCKYFKQGKGACPFGGACFYLHAKPDGTKVELPPPTRRRRQNQDGELDLMGRIILWDYLEVRDQSVLMQLDLDDYVYALSDDSDRDSDSSEEENFFISESF